MALTFPSAPPHDTVPMLSELRPATLRNRRLGSGSENSLAVTLDPSCIKPLAYSMANALLPRSAVQHLGGQKTWIYNHQGDKLLPYL